MKILLLGDFSNYHYTLGQALRKLGHQVTVASNGTNWMHTQRDISLYRRPGKLSGAWLWAKLNTVLAPRFKGYDIVQIASPIFLDLMPHRVEAFFKFLKKHNGAVYLTAIGTDTALLETALMPDSPLVFSEWSVNGRPTEFSASEASQLSRKWLDDRMSRHCRMIYDNVDGVVSVLYEYHVAMKRYVPDSKLAYGGIPIDVTGIPFNPVTIDPSRKVRVLAPFHSRRRVEKGIDLLCDIVRPFDRAEISMVSDLRLDVFLETMRRFDFVLDQYYAHTPATTALLCMAMGIPVATGGSAQFEAFIGRRVPVVNVNPLDHATLTGFMNHITGSEQGAKLPHGYGTLGEMLLDARAFVEEHNADTVVANRFLDFWRR